MRSLSAADLLEVWERAYGEHPVDRALTLLSACSEEPRQQLAHASIGRRDARLLEMYERLFGPGMEAFAQCPQCDERLEYSMSTRELIRSGTKSEEPLALETEERYFQLRLPDSQDLRAASECRDLQAARNLLLKRCATAAPATAVEDLPESVVDEIASRLVQADPLMETIIDLTCCACRHSWQVVLDIAEFLWAKISALAKRLLREVHALAWAYGWHEQDILRLSAVRRQAYLEMAGA